MPEPTSSLRVLLVHANPVQRALPVQPYGLERVASAARAAGADVRITDPYLWSADADEFLAREIRVLSPQVIGFGLRVLEDCIPIATLDDSDHPIDVYSVLPEVRSLVARAQAVAPDALFVMGGAGFSSAPLECLEYLNLSYGVTGAGEHAFVQLLAHHQRGEPIDTVPGVVKRGTPLRANPYQAHAVSPVVEREPFYAPVLGTPVRARIGCGMTCSYCTAAALRRVKATDDVNAVVDEIELYLEQTTHKRFSEADLFLAADEFNLPDERHGIAILEELERRDLPYAGWRGYFNPTPFSDRLAELIKQTRGWPSVTVDSASDAVLKANRKPFRRRHLDELVDRLARFEIEYDLGVICGMPGETEETLQETVDFIFSLPEDVEVVYSAGARIYPNTPLYDAAASEPGRIYTDGREEDMGVMAPRVYCALGEPRALARRLARVFESRPPVHLMGAGFNQWTKVLGDAHRACATGGAVDWQQLIAETAGERQADALRYGLAEIAFWHGNLAYAGEAFAAVSPEHRSEEAAARLDRALASARASA